MLKAQRSNTSKPTEIIKCDSMLLVTQQHIVIYVTYATRLWGNAEIVGLDIDGRMCVQLTELILQNFIP